MYLRLNTSFGTLMLKRIKKYFLCYYQDKYTENSIKDELLISLLPTVVFISILLFKYESFEQVFLNIFTSEHLFEGLFLIVFLMMLFLNLVKYICCKIKKKPVHFINPIIEAIIKKL